jgi:hypothetical protein
MLCDDLPFHNWPSFQVAEQTHSTDYTATQLLAAEARTIGVEAIRAPSAQRAGGMNVAVLEPAAFVPPPKPHSSWASLANEDGLMLPFWDKLPSDFVRVSRISARDGRLLLGR